MEPALVEAARRRVWVPPIESAADVRRWACIRMAVLGTVQTCDRVAAAWVTRVRSLCARALARVLFHRGTRSFLAMRVRLLRGGVAHVKRVRLPKRRTTTLSPTPAQIGITRTHTLRRTPMSPHFACLQDADALVLPNNNRKARLRSHAGVCAHARCGARELFARAGPAA